MGYLINQDNNFKTEYVVLLSPPPLDMLKRITLILFLCLQVTLFLFAQQMNISQLADSLRRNNNHASVIREVNNLLNQKNWTDSDKLVLQGIIVGKLMELQMWDSCLNYCQGRVALAHQQKNALAEATFYKLIGNTYYHIPDKEKAIQYWEKCMAICIPRKFDLLLEQCYHNIGSVIIESGKNYDQAEQYFLQAIKLSGANKTDTTPLGNQHYRLLATLYRVTNRYEKADKLFATVIERARQRNDSLQIAEALMFYSTLLADEKKIDKAIESGEEALLISKKFNKLDMEITALEMLAVNYAAAGNYKEAFDFMSRVKAQSVNRFKTDLNSKISEAGAKFKNAELQHEKELALLNANKEKQVLLVAGIALFLISGFILYYLYQKRNTKQKLQMQQQLQEEKERISRDLHDNLGSQMALLSNNIEALDTNFKKQQNIDDSIEKVKGSSRQLLQTLREAIWILNKEQVRSEEFFDKLVDYSRRYVQQVSCIRLETNENLAETKILQSNEALQLFRICQEAINNACKYSDSAELVLSAKVNYGKFEIEIIDKGRGFVPNRIDDDQHYGLKNMQKRADEINAALKIHTKEAEGTTIQIIL